MWPILEIIVTFLLVDINECEEEIDECEEHCYNSIGSYFCNCTGPGYRLHSDGNTCESKSVLLWLLATNPKKLIFGIL